MRACALVLIAACGSPSASSTNSDGGGGEDAGSAIIVGSGSCTAAPAPETGQATYYDANGSGNCSFDASTDFMVAAMNAADYGNAQWCGACIAVTGPMGNSITVRVVDQCSGCSQGSLDLSETAFGMLSPLSAGRIQISWHEVPCDVTGPIAYNFQMGASQFYAAIQIRNSRYPIAAIDAMQGSASTSLAKQSYNYYVEKSGLGTGPYDLRVTDERGQVIEDPAIALGDGTTEDGASQYAVCPGD